MQVQALIKAATGMFASPAFIVHAFRHASSSMTETDHGLDIDAINGVFTALLKVRVRKAGAASAECHCMRIDSMTLICEGNPPSHVTGRQLSGPAWADSIR